MLPLNMTTQHSFEVAFGNFFVEGLGQLPSKLKPHVAYVVVIAATDFSKLRVTSSVHLSDIP